MTEKKLTPRVGDRVLFVLMGRTNVGNIKNINSLGLAWVVSDGNVGWWFDPTTLEVRDREPVEWPEGWNNRSSVRTNVVIVPDAGDYSVTLSREGFNRIRGPEGDYVAEHWDELVGGSA